MQLLASIYDLIQSEINGMLARNLCGKRIKLARIAKEMTQVDLSAALSVDLDFEISQKALSRLERGIRPVTDIELVLLSKTLDVSVLWLIFGDKGEPAKV